MGSVLSQIMVVVVMNIRSLPQRIWMSLTTLAAIAIVVAVLLAFLAMGNGFRATVANSGSDALAVVLRDGSQAELNSVISSEQAKLMSLFPDIVHDEKGALVSTEMYVIVDGKKRTTNTEVNLPLRGISQRGIDIREGVRIIQGRMFETGTNEIVVGASILNEFTGFELGKQVKLGTATWKVVGVFEAKGSVFESELWADLSTLQTQFRRGNSVQIVRMQLKTPGDVSAIQRYIDADPRLNLEVRTEAEYFSEQATATSDVIFYLGWPLAIAMALGALAGALNTMYTSVAQRAKEIATLRAIGFSSLSAFFGTLMESLVLAIIGGLLGTFAAFMFFDGISASTLSSSFAQIVFDFKISSAAFSDGIMLAVAIGLLGGFFPALHASRVPVVLAFKDE